jgi:hypothetical protein
LESGNWEHVQQVQSGQADAPITKIQVINPGMSFACFALLFNNFIVSVLILICGRVKKNAPLFSGCYRQSSVGGWRKKLKRLMGPHSAGVLIQYSIKSVAT